MTKLNQIEIDRVIEMAWEDRTPFGNKISIWINRKKCN